MAHTCYDVIVVGAGIVGSSLAYHLAKAGLMVALLEKETVASGASQAAAGMLAPLDGEEGERDPEQKVTPFYLAALDYYTHLDQELKEESGIDIGLSDAPTLRPAFNERDRDQLQSIIQQHHLTGLQWLDHHDACRVEPLLPPTIIGALFSPQERNVEAAHITLAYARAAERFGTALFEGYHVEHILRQGQRVVGVSTSSGCFYADHVVLATGAWTGRWQEQRVPPAVFPIKGQMLAVSSPTPHALQHIIYHARIGCIVPKVGGSIYIGATAETVGFDKTVTVAGLSHALSIMNQLAPALAQARFERAWAGLRPGSVDTLPLLGPSLTTPGLWIASGHGHDGILLGPLTGHILAEWVLGHRIPFHLDLTPFDPDRFGAWL